MKNTKIKGLEVEGKKETASVKLLKNLDAEQKALENLLGSSVIKKVKLRSSTRMKLNINELSYAYGKDCDNHYNFRNDEDCKTLEEAAAKNLARVEEVVKGKYSLNVSQITSADKDCIIETRKILFNLVEKAKENIWSKKMTIQMGNTIKKYLPLNDKEYVVLDGNTFCQTVEICSEAVKEGLFSHSIQKAAKLYDNEDYKMGIEMYTSKIYAGTKKEFEKELIALGILNKLAENNSKSWETKEVEEFGLRFYQFLLVSVYSQRYKSVGVSFKDVLIQAQILKVGLMDFNKKIETQNPTNELSYIACKSLTSLKAGQTKGSLTKGMFAITQFKELLAIILENNTEICEFDTAVNVLSIWITTLLKLQEESRKWDNCPSDRTRLKAITSKLASDVDFELDEVKKSIAAKTSENKRSSDSTEYLENVQCKFNTLFDAIKTKTTEAFACLETTFKGYTAKDVVETAGDEFLDEIEFLLAERRHNRSRGNV